MHHHINHCFCTQAEHNNDFYDAGNMVDIDKLEHDADDWDKLIETKQIVSKEKLDMYKSIQEVRPDVYSNKMVTDMAMADCPVLKAEVRQWLNDNVNPQKDGEPGWAVGTDDYNMVQSYRMVLFFQRRNDTKKFIKTFSKYKKATSYFNYMKDPIVNKVLDIETNKYKNRHEEDV